MLLGIDGSASSLRAMDYAVGAAYRANAVLLVAYVRPVLPSYLNDQSAVEYFLGTQIALMSELQAEVLAACGPIDLPHQFVSPQGDPFTELKRLAEDHSADAVVIGASAHVLHRLLTSVATRFVRTACCPVTVVP